MQYVIPAILSLAVVLAGGLLLWGIKKKRPRLDYEVIESEPFPREGGEARYFVIRLRNAGNTPLENIDLRVVFPALTVDLIRFSDDRLIEDVSQGQSELTGAVPLLNPGETFSLTVTTRPADSVSTPKVQARALGATAVPRPAQPPPGGLAQLVSGALFGAAVGLLASMLLFGSLFGGRLEHLRLRVERASRRYGEVEVESDSMKKEVRKTRALVDDWRSKLEHGAAERPHIIFAALNRSGLSHLIPELLGPGAGAEYWRSGLFLMHRFLVEPGSRDKHVAAMEQLLNAESMVPCSKGFIFYLLGKMEQLRGNNDKATEHFDACKKEAPLMYEHLISQDPAYDLQSVRDSLLTGRAQREGRPGGGHD